MMYIGIDPDIEKSGYAVGYKPPASLYGDSYWKIMQVNTESFARIVWQLEGLDKNDLEVIVFIEAGWLNKKSNFHPKQGARVREKIAKNVGENHAVGKLIAQMCEAYGIPYKLVIPKSRKVNAEEFKQLTGWEGKTNQEMRDAGMLVWREMNEQKILERVKK